jgi:hypothetical protein
MPNLIERILGTPTGSQAAVQGAGQAVDTAEAQAARVAVRGRAGWPDVAERRAIKDYLKAEGFKEAGFIGRLLGRDLGLGVLDDDTLTREQLADLIVAMQRQSPRG